MTSEAAIEIARAEKAKHGDLDNFGQVSAELRIIQIIKGPRESPEAFRDAKVWIVRFSKQNRAWECAVELRTGEILRVRRTR